VFQFLSHEVLPDHMILAIASDDAYVLGVLSSRAHVAWALGAGGRLGVGNDPRYNKSRCFDPFPFPVPTDEQRVRIREIAERLDQHRKTQQALHPSLTLTGVYNVLEKLKRGEPFSAKDKTIHEHGLVSILRQLHDELDAAVFETYGWPVDLSDQEILTRLVSLNAERASEEEKGIIRWLRPGLQDKSGARKAVQTGLAGTDQAEVAPTDANRELPTWPKALPDRISAVRDLLHARPEPVGIPEARKAFKRAPARDIEAALETLASLGLVVRYDTPEGRRWKALRT